MRHGKGTDLPGMTDPEGARVGVIYVSPEDDRKTVLTAILAEERLKREQIVLILPLQNRAFQRPQDFDDLKMLRRKIQADLIFVTPAGPGPAEFARQRRFAVFSTEESFVRSFMTGSPNPPVWSTSTPSKTSQPNNRPAKKGLFGFGGAKKAAPIAAAGAAGFVAGGAVGKTEAAGTSGTAGSAGNNTPQRRSRGLTPAGDVTNLPTQPVAKRLSRPLRPADPLTPIPQTQDEDAALRPAGVEAADTIDQHDNKNNTGLRNAGLAGAAGLGAGLLAADFSHRVPSTGPNIDNDDDWDNHLPPAPGQSPSSKLPNTPAATGTGIVGVKTASTSGSPMHTPIPAIDPNPIELPMSRGTTKVTKKLSPPAVAGMATQAVPTSAPTATTSTTPRRNTGKMAAAGAAGAVAGVMAAEALTNGASNTGKATAGATRTPNAAGGTRPPMRNLSSIGPGGPGMGGPMNPRRTPPHRNWRRIAVVALIIITILLLCGWTVSAHPDMLSNVSHTLTGNSNTPATISITPASKTVQDTYLMQGVTTGTANPDDRQVTVRTINSTKSTTKSTTATGHTQTAAVAATGTLTFLNGSTSAETIAPTPITNANGIQVIADQNVTIPGLNLNNGQAGTAAVSAHAVSPGVSGNIGAGTINGTCCLAGGFIIVKNGTFSGGVDAQNYNFLQASDVSAVTTANQDALKTNAQNDIKSQMKTGEQLLGNINCDDPKTTEDVLPGAHGVNVTSANVTVNVSCSAEVFDASAVQTIAQKALQQKASKDPGPGFVLAGTIVTQAQQPVIQQDSISFPVVARGVWYYPWTTAMKQALLNKIKGKSTAQAQTILNSYPGVGSAKINNNNGGGPLSGDINQITLDIKTVNGLPGGNQQPGTGGNSTVSPQSSITPIGGNGVIPPQPVGSVKG